VSYLPFSHIYYNMTFSSKNIMFTEGHTIPDGIPITQTQGGPVIAVNIGGTSIPMIADTGAESGKSAAKVDISRIQKGITNNYTRGHITKTVTTYFMPLEIPGITYIEPMDVGADAKSVTTCSQ
jgi:hypothetical protein